MDVKIYTSIIFKIFRGITHARNFSARICSMVYTPGELRPAILVDYDAFGDDEAVIDWLKRRQPLFAVHLLVSNVEYNDYSPDSDIEFDTVIRNTGNKPNIDFKMHAYRILQDVSTTTPVLAIEWQKSITDFYVSNGLVVVHFGNGQSNAS